MRVYQLAQELGLGSGEVLEMVTELEPDVVSTLSSLDDETVEAIRSLVRAANVSEPVGPPDLPSGPEPGQRRRSRRTERNTNRPERASEPRVLSQGGGGIDVISGSVLALIVVYLVLNRVIPDRFVLPFGASVRAYELIMLVLLGAWVLWTVIEPKPFPTGLLGLSALCLFAALLLAPMLHFNDMSPFQADGAERGVIRVILLSGLFLAAYHVGSRIGWARRVLAVIVALTVLQALLAIWEYQTETPIFFFDELARSLGMIDDPQSIRSEFVDVFERLTGEVRAVGTAPHPIVLSAVIALGAMVAAGWFVGDGAARGRRGWLIVALAALMLGLPTANSRTGYVILMGAFVPLVILTVRHAARLIPLTAGAAVMMAIAFALSPRTPRLLLNSFTQPDNDPNFQIRVERFEVLPQLVAENPVLGVGYLTHDPGIQIFDNAYNLALVETGVLGLVLLVGFFLMVLIRCWTAYEVSLPSEQPVVFAGVAAALAVLLGGITFDAWTFDQFLPTALIIMGLGTGVSRYATARGSNQTPLRREELAVSGSRV